MKVRAFLLFLVAIATPSMANSQQVTREPYVDTLSVTILVENHDSLEVQLYMNNQSHTLTSLKIAKANARTMLVLPSDGLVGLDSITILGVRLNASHHKVDKISVSPMRDNLGRPLRMVNIWLYPAEVPEPKKPRPQTSASL